MNFVTYLRVSTQQQGKSGLGIEAQRFECERYLSAIAGTSIAELVEVESGGKDDRPQLAAAMALAKRHKATLLIAKLDRLSRDAHFLLGLAKAGVDFVCADMPNANRLTVGIMACVAEEERRMISARTKAALAAAKSRGVKLGGRREANGVSAASAAAALAANERSKPVRKALVRLQASGVTSLSALARSLSEEGHVKPRGQGVWTARDVSNLLARSAESC